MPIEGKWVRYGEHSGYLAYPERAQGPLPSVLVIQEIWGVEAQIEDLTRRVAAAGYVALAPDLYAKKGVRPAAFTAERVAQVQHFANTAPQNAWADPALRDAELDKLAEPLRSQVKESLQKLFSTPGRLPELVSPLRDAVRFLKKENPSSLGQKTACVGFCMGGGLAALLACEEPEIAGTAIFYGSAPPLEKVPQIAGPVIGFYAGNDQRINQGIPAFEAAMKEHRRSFEHVVYEGAFHGFFNETGRSYNVAAVRDSFVRLLQFFQRTLTAQG